MKSTNTRNTLRLWLLFASVAISACTSARNRTGDTNLFETLEFSSGEVHQFLAENLRSGSVYFEFEPILSVDVIFKSAEFNRLFNQELSESYGWNEAEQKKHLEQLNTDAGKFRQFLVFLQQKGGRPIKLNKNKNWAVYWKDADKDRISPSQIRPVKVDSVEQNFLAKYLNAVDRWSEGYEISIPYLWKDDGSEELNGALHISGIQGEVSIVFTPSELTAK